MRVGVIIALIAGFAMGVRAEYRDFLDAQGRAVRGKVLKYDPNNKRVTLERANKKLARTPIEVFSEEDQAYILDWYAGQTFANERAFNISVKRMTEETTNSKGSEKWNNAHEVENKSYLVRLENKSSVSLSGLRAEYCVFYEQRSFVNKEKVTELGLLYGQFKLGEIPARSTQESSTQNVMVYKSRSDKAVLGQVIGIWLRVHMETESGVKMTRDYKLPDSLGNSRGFSTQSIPAGLNK